MIICTMTTASHLFRAKVMAASAKRHHPQAKIVVCLLEKRHRGRASRVAHFDRVVLAKELGIPDFHTLLFTRNVHEASFVLKGHFIKYLFAAYPYENDIVFLDTDTEVFSPMTEVTDALRRHAVVLTPHESYDAKESHYYHGIFNIGFIALARGDETKRFLDWWISRTDRYCYDEYQGLELFYEQGWLDLAPTLFDVHILDHPGYNLAFWNFRERASAITEDGNGVYVLGQPLRFFHFSNLTGALLHAMLRYFPDPGAPMRRLYDRYVHALARAGQRQSGGMRWSYDYYANGKRIVPAARARYRHDAALRLKYPNPYNQSNAILLKSSSKLHIVQVISNAPDAYPLPPVNQGGTEKVVYELTEKLARRGHRVTLFAARGSQSSARLVPYPASVNERNIGAFVARRLPRGVDIIHDHTFNSAVSRRHLRAPVVCTQHITRNYGVANPVYVSRRALEVIGRNRGDYVYNGINPEEYELSEVKGDYLLFMGRLVREKGVLQALEVAERTGQRLRIAGPIKDRELFEKEIRPRLDANPNLEYVGAVGGAEKQALLKHARCLLFPTMWEEPFGLVMIEAMACGTPVLGLAHGAVPEVLEGFPSLICRSVDEMAHKVLHEPFPAPQALRDYVLRHFTNDRMTDRYLDIYDRVKRNPRIRRRRKAAVGLRKGGGRRQGQGRVRRPASAKRTAARPRRTKVSAGSRKTGIRAGRRG